MTNDDSLHTPHDEFEYPDIDEEQFFEFLEAQLDNAREELKLAETDEEWRAGLARQKAYNTILNAWGNGEFEPQDDQ